MNRETKQTENAERSIAAIKLALTDCRSARANLRRAGADHAAAYVGRAIKSIEGALRHAYGKHYRQKKESR